MLYRIQTELRYNLQQPDESFMIRYTDMLDEDGLQTSMLGLEFRVSLRVLREIDTSPLWLHAYYFKIIPRIKSFIWISNRFDESTLTMAT